MPHQPPPPSATHSSSTADAEAVAAEALKKSGKVLGREVIDEGLGTTGPVETLAPSPDELENQDGRAFIPNCCFRTGKSGKDTRVKMD